jgi:hypothetical protein
MGHDTERVWKCRKGHAAGLRGCGAVARRVPGCLEQACEGCGADTHGVVVWGCEGHDGTTTWDGVDAYQSPAVCPTCWREWSRMSDPWRHGDVCEDDRRDAYGMGAA